MLAVLLVGFGEQFLNLVPLGGGEIVLLGLVYPKNEQDNLTASERDEIRKLLAEIHEQYSRQNDQ